MGDFPSSAAFDLGSTVILSTGSNAIGDTVVMTGQGAGSAVWPAAERAIYVPFYLERTTTFVQMIVYNGATAAGNVDVGIYDYAGNRLTASVAAAQAGTSTIQVFNTADVTLLPGTYFMAMLCTLGTATVFRCTTNSLVLQAAGVQQQGAVTTLPATATFASPASSFLPLFGVVSAAVV